ncbi:MAG: hypothetical protein MK066_14630 [Crocinitomicaceae bacterium]|nr:hypothetical protein [Crocinitomicaceae bacterium]
MKINIFIYRTLFIAFVLLTKATVYAQPTVGPPPSGGGSTGTTPHCWDPECVPVDSGLIFLLAAGMLLGVKIMFAHRSKSRA